MNISKLVEKYFLREAVAKKVLRFHHEVALRCVVPHMRDAASDVPHHSDNGWKLDDPVYLPPLLAEAHVVCPEFAAMLKKILHELQWSPTGDNGALSGTSLLELCVLSIRAIGVLAPVFCGGKWRLVGTDPLASVVDLDVVRLFRTWKRIFSALRCPAGLPFENVRSATSTSALGLRLFARGSRVGSRTLPHVLRSLWICVGCLPF